MDANLSRPLSRRKLLAGLAAAPLAAALGGCRMFEFLRQPFEPVCTLPPNISKSELLQRLNANIARVASWRSSQVTIHTSETAGRLIKLQADLAVERPRNFRLVAKSLLGYEADFGSNDRQFWFWVRRGQPKHIYFASYHDLEAVGGRLPIPIRPDWLMEALGVIPIDESSVYMEPRDPASEFIRLVSERTTPDGRLVRRVIVVDGCHGNIVSHSLQNAAGEEIARAALGDYREYRLDAITTVSLPHRIDIEWPLEDASMAMTFGSIEVNPPPMPEHLWRMPAYREYPPFDLARAAMRRPGMSSAEFPPDYGGRAAEIRHSSPPRFSDEAGPSGGYASGRRRIEPGPYGRY